MVDVFEEVEEELRADRYRDMVRKGWPWGLAFVLTLVLGWGGYWGWRKYEENTAAKASIAYVKAMEAMSKADTAGAEKAFVEVEKAGAKGYKALGLMQQAGLKLNAGDAKAAVALFDQAASAANDPMIADAARLKAAYVLLDTAPLAEMEKRLTPLTDAKRPFALLAREALAVSRLMAGQVDKAKADFAVISISPDVTQFMRDRALAANLMIEAGHGAQLPGLVKQAAARPELPVVPQVIPPPEAGNTQ